MNRIYIITGEYRCHAVDGRFPILGRYAFTNEAEAQIDIERVRQNVLEFPHPIYGAADPQTISLKVVGLDLKESASDGNAPTSNQTGETKL